MENNNASVLTIGNEILTGLIADSNSQWICRELDSIGIGVQITMSVRDEAERILTALDYLSEKSDIIIITGGLGPTNDDITKKTLCSYFGGNLVLSDVALSNITELFKARGYELTETNRNQAFVADNCDVLNNKMGTAPGMWFEKDGKIFISLPGVPFEMKHLMSEFVIPKFTRMFASGHIIHKVICTQGVGESFLSDKIQQWELNLPRNYKLAYLPSPGIVKLRISAYLSDEELPEYESSMIKIVSDLYELVGEFIYTYNGLTLQEEVGLALIKKNKTVSTAESCTGGYIAHLITSVAGSSAYFKGSIIAYANEIKEAVLGVDARVLDEYGAVSEETVSQMALGVREKCKTDYSIAISGIAGPRGATLDKKVGTVYIGIADEEGVTVKKMQFGDERNRNIERSALTALKMLFDKIK